MNNILFFTVVFLFSGNLLARDTTTGRSDSVNVNMKPELTISKCKASEVVIDGILDEPVWETCNTATDFVEIEPGDNLPASVKTDVKMTYDEDNLYVAFICYDDRMSKLRVNLTDRDKMYQDDFVGILIDTYNDHKQAYEIFLNPFGIQGDGIWTKQGEEMNFDMLYEAEAKIYKDKWIVELAVPFKSIRFPDKDEQQWGVHIIRTRPRESRTQFSWAKVSRDNSEFLSQAGIIKGFKKLKKGQQLELLPFVLGSQFGYREDESDPGSKFINEKIKGDLGIGVKYGFSSNLTGEISINPDFSQVESDAAQISVNSSSAVFYPEKRPFFLDGANIFKSYINVVYTRMLNNPLYTAKLIGKIDDIDVGYLMGYDQNTPFIVPGKYGSDFILTDLKSFGNALRLRKSLKGSSYIGFIGTDHETGDSYNRVVGLDGSFNFAGKYYFNWQALGYFTKELNDSAIYSNSTAINSVGNDAGFNGESLSGFGGTFALVRSSRNWNGEVFLNIAPPEARRELGYMSKNDFRELGMWHGYTIYPHNSVFLRIEPNFNTGVQYSYDGKIKEQWLVPQFYIQFKHQINLSGGYLAINNENYYDVYHKNVNRGWLNININTSSFVTGGAFYELGKYIVRFEEPSYIGWGFNAEAWMTIKPINNLVLENNYSYFELSKEKSAEKLYSGYIFRNKTSFQFTRRFFLRLVMQYDSFNRSFDIDPLFSYKWNPFTIFYIGSTHNLADIGKSQNHGRFLETQRQFFAKFQYLFKM
ncbi:MAG TPA: carbohydrate binding family 9 domain-containing protein [Ignavibacteria bacterium]|nr:carbohydrate binding family 9 domain-containing protein [Ignavibacteria bacterium]